MRYFIVFYAGMRNGHDFNDSVNISQPHYPNKKEFEEMVSDWVNADDINPYAVAITNIIEIKEQDYQEWIR